MSKHYEGHLLGKGLKFGVVVSRFNEFFSRKLLEGAQDGLLRHGVSDTDIEIAWTPGSFWMVWRLETLHSARSFGTCAIIFPMLRR